MLMKQLKAASEMPCEVIQALPSRQVMRPGLSAALSVPVYPLQLRMQRSTGRLQRHAEYANQSPAATGLRCARDATLSALIGTGHLPCIARLRRSGFIVKQPRDDPKLAFRLSAGLSYHKKSASQASSSKIFDMALVAEDSADWDTEGSWMLSIAATVGPS